MNMFQRITLVATALFCAASCQRLPDYFTGDVTLARAGENELHLRDVRSVVPVGVSGEDSAAYMNLYVERWVRKQIKLQEAEKLFSSSAADIDRMVESYRQALLIRKLEQHYVDSSVDTTFTDEQVRAYYNAHKADLKLDRTIVKGRIVRFGEGYRQSQKLKDQMASRTESVQEDFLDICAKNDFALNDFSVQWVDFPEYLSYLPTLQSQNYDGVLSPALLGKVQEMRDSHSRYYFQIFEIRREGEPIPLERVSLTIRRILFNERQSEIIRTHEEELYRRSLEQGEVKYFAHGGDENEKEENKKTKDIQNV